MLDGAPPIRSNVRRAVYYAALAAHSVCISVCVCGIHILHTRAKINTPIRVPRPPLSRLQDPAGAHALEVAVDKSVVSLPVCVRVCARVHISAKQREIAETKMNV